jgi:hypothetical protein
MDAVVFYSKMEFEKEIDGRVEIMDYRISHWQHMVCSR